MAQEQQPDGAVQALELSIVASLSSTAIALAFGFPLAWLLARGRFPGKGAVRGLTTLPMVLPPVVGGIALLLAYGRKGFIGKPLESATGVTLPFTLAGVIVAESFVAMPFFVITVESGLRSMNRRLEDAARSLGAGVPHILWVHILPNVLGPLIVATTLSVGDVILFESVLSFLGLGVQPPLSSWGSMLSNAQELITAAPLLAVYPGLMIFLTVMACNLLGDALQRRLDPAAGPGRPKAR